MTNDEKFGYHLPLRHAACPRCDHRAVLRLALRREPLNGGAQRLTLRSKVKPLFAGVDPYNYYIDRNSDDNLIAVTAS